MTLWIALLLCPAALFAASLDGISYPVRELGNCASEAACRAFCDRTDKPGNVKACVAFARKHSLQPEGELKRSEALIRLVESGRTPGGCKTMAACDAYCEDPAHIQECVRVAERFGVLPPEELAEVKKVARALASGARLPGNCRGKKACKAYCENPAHMKECFEFAERAGIIPASELKLARKMLPLMRSGKTPGGCRSKAACDAYCDDPAHLDECIAFAEKTGMMSKQEAAMVRKTGGLGPGGCRGKMACDAFCSKPANEKTCREFGEKHGLGPKGGGPPHGRRPRGP